MIDKKFFDREDIALRRMYEEGKIDYKEFLELLLNSKEADRTRRDIVRENKNTAKELVES